MTSRSLAADPAGSTVATLLQKAGHRCVVFESTSFPRYHIGESLIPQTYSTFERLGLLPELRSSNFPLKYSVRFVSPTGKEAAPFYFFETIEGERARTWQVKRSEFDQLCQNNARDSGVEIRSNTTVRKVLFSDEKAIEVRVETTGQPPEDVSARVVVDSSGRGTFLGKQLGLRTDIPGLDKSAIWTYFKGGHRGEGLDAGETAVFMIPGRGWFWYIPLPEDIISVGIGQFVPQLWQGVEVIHRLVRAFYDPDFSFPEFAKRFPAQGAALIDCLIGDVVGRDMTAFLEALASMTPPPEPLHVS